MKDVVKFSTGGALVDPNSLRSALQVATTERPNAGGALPFLRLTKAGEWVYGPENVEVEEDSRWAIHPGSFQHGYCAWDDGELLGDVMVPLNVPRPTFAELPPLTDTDATWDEQVSFMLACTSGEDAGQQVLFKTSSRGGRTAWSDVATAILAQLDRDASRPAPIVTLTASSYRHKKYGTVYTPTFEIVGWSGLSDTTVEEAAPKEARKVAKAKPAPTVRTKRTRR